MNKSYLIVTSWKSPYREIDCILHDEGLARKHRDELVREGYFDRPDVCIIAIEGGDHGAAADEIEDLFRAEKSFGRAGAKRLCETYGCDRITFL